MDYIESNCDFKQSIVFEEVVIDSFSMDSIPEKYTVLNFLTISPINSADSTLNRLYFFKKNRNYEWNYINKSTLYETLPITMRADSWYLIRALLVNGNPNGKIFIYIDKENEYHFIYTSNKTGY